jgi:hypothetical protein
LNVGSTHWILVFGLRQLPVTSNQPPPAKGAPMSTTLATCHYVHDNGGTCNSVAAKNQRYCVYHFRHLARLMRLAKYRARHQRFELKLPPLENMYAVQSALNQICEAAAAGMIELQQARFLLSVIRASGHFFLRADKWQANPYYSNQSTEVDLVAEYGLPKDLDLRRSPEEVFPTSQPTDACDRNLVTEDREPISDNRPPTTDNVPAPPDLPFSGGYCADHQSRECECLRIRADYPVTPEMVEVVEVSATHGSDAAAARSKQLERNRERRRLNRDGKRYAAIALEHNLRLAAARMAELKLAERAKAQGAKEESGGPTPAFVAAVGVARDSAKKPPSAAAAAQKSALTPTGSHG